MRLAVDVMGGDQGPEELLHGVKLGLGTAGIDKLYVVGQQELVQPVLKKLRLTDSRLEFVHASEVLTMDDKPVQGLRRKRDSSILKAVDLLRDGAADALISSGNT